MNNNLVEAEIWTIARTNQGNAVLLRPFESQLAVPIFIGNLETQSILIGLGSVHVPRPLTHDLLLSLFEQLNIKITKVEIHDIQNNTFFAKIYYLFQDKEGVIDARPSDAIGIAVRLKMPIFIAEFIVAQVGIDVRLLNEPDPEAIFPDLNETGEFSSVQDDLKSKLEQELEIALNNENYELAAVIRDQIINLENESF